MADKKRRRKGERRVPVYIDMAGGPPRKSSVSEDDALRAFWVPAASDSWRTALNLLHKFAEEGTSASPVLVAYVAECVRSWLATDCAKEAAQAAFHLKRPTHREPSSEIEQKHVRAIATYLTSRGDGLTREDALSVAAKDVSLAVKSIAPLVEGLHRSEPQFTPLQIQAISLIAIEPFFPEYTGPARDPEFLRSCLGGGWSKWEKYLSARQARLEAVRRRSMKG